MQRTWWPEAGTIIVTGPYSWSINWRRNLLIFWWKIPFSTIFYGYNIHLYMYVRDKRPKSLHFVRRTDGCSVEEQHARRNLDDLEKRLMLSADFLWNFYTSNGTYYAVAMSVCPSVRLSVRPSVRVFRTFLQHALRYQFETWYIHSVVARHVEFELHHNWVTLT